MSAFELQARGLDVTVLEKGECGRESSWAGGGILSPLYPWRYPDAVTRLAHWSQERYQGICDELLSETGIDPEWTQSGLLMLDLGKEELRSANQWAQRFGYNLQTLQSSEVTRLMPGLGVAAGDSAWMPEVAQVRNPRFLKALKSLLLKRGVTITEYAPVTEILSDEGKVRGLRSGDSVVSAERIVICSGAWSAELLKPLGIEVAISPVKGQMLLYHARPGLLKQIVMHEGYYLIPRRDGRILAGSTLEHVGFDKQVTEGAKSELHRKAVSILPALADVEVEFQWAGLRPGTSDGVPYIGPLPNFDGLFINAGQYRNGVVTGLASAVLAANWVSAERTILSPEPYLPTAE